MASVDSSGGGSATLDGSDCGALSGAVALGAFGCCALAMGVGARKPSSRRTRQALSTARMAKAAGFASVGSRWATGLGVNGIENEFQFHNCTLALGWRN